MAPILAFFQRVWKQTSTSLACMQVDQPLCYDCIHRVQDEVEVSIREAQHECAAYEAALARLREDDTQPYTDEVCSASILHLSSCFSAHHTRAYLEIVCAAYGLHLSAILVKQQWHGW